MKVTRYGFTAPSAEIAAILGVTPAQMMRSAFDMDLADCCRSLVNDSIDLHDEAAIRAWSAKQNRGSSYPPTFVDALVFVAKSFVTEPPHDGGSTRQ